jgi:hypothetical protein
MKYRGFREETLLAAARELESLELKPAEVYAILNLAGAKWRSVQIREGRGDEAYEEEDGQVFHEATVALMKATMAENQQLAELGHTTDGERFMLLAISITMNKLFLRGPRSIRKWLGSGDGDTRKIILSFAMGSSIIVESGAIGILIRRIVKFRYGAISGFGKDVSDSIIEIIEKLGNSGYSCLKPITDSMK